MDCPIRGFFVDDFRADHHIAKIMKHMLRFLLPLAAVFLFSKVQASIVPTPTQTLTFWSLEELPLAGDRLEFNAHGIRWQTLGQQRRMQMYTIAAQSPLSEVISEEDTEILAKSAGESFSEAVAYVIEPVYTIPLHDGTTQQPVIEQTIFAIATGESDKKYLFLLDHDTRGRLIAQFIGTTANPDLCHKLLMSPAASERMQ